MAQIDAAIASARRAARTELTAAHPEHTAIQTLIARTIPTSSCSRDTLLTIADQHTTLPAFIAAIATRMRSESAEGYATNRDHFGTPYTPLHARSSRHGSAGSQAAMEQNTLWRWRTDALHGLHGARAAGHCATSCPGPPHNAQRRAPPPPGGGTRPGAPPPPP
ncbi:hypothetical protein NFJ02_02g75110 [Pycnococcus provasolii]